MSFTLRTPRAPPRPRHSWAINGDTTCTHAHDALNATLASSMGSRLVAAGGGGGRGAERQRWGGVPRTKAWRRQAKLRTVGAGGRGADVANDHVAR